MYPREYFDTYWRGELRNEVFVIMSFDEQFDPIWESAIKPAIEIDTDGKPFAHRVNETILAGSVVTEILDGIAHAKLIFADISVCKNEPWQGQRNGNAMYEVGVAHAIRQPEEMLLVRSDNQQINFDVAGIKIQSYDDSDLAGSRTQFGQLLADSLLQIDQIKSLQVTKAVESLDYDALSLLRLTAREEDFHVERPKNMREIMEESTAGTKPAVRHLLSLGVIRSAFHGADSRCDYKWTGFGLAVLQKLGFR